ncbi:unnamed protein product [Prorocentrum cordatum]|uniref:Uncharacterized protein n=1 Tax=Prorocentrum cordatum TaxID=2364126 RepID=A0ABN9XVT4_9DINO|nr:unnamed protein product [Polarella glacialis]
MAAQAARLRWALRRELPRGVGKVAEDIVVHLAQSLEEPSAQEEGEVVEDWPRADLRSSASSSTSRPGPTRRARVACACASCGASAPAARRAASRPRPAPGPRSRPRATPARPAPRPAGRAGRPAAGGRRRAPRRPRGSTGRRRTYVRWLSEWMERLCIAEYAAAARGWCAEMGAAEVDEVLDEWEGFCDALRLKPLQRKRVRRDAEGRALACPPGSEPHARCWPSVPAAPPEEELERRALRQNPQLGRPTSQVWWPARSATTTQT